MQLQLTRKVYSEELLKKSSTTHRDGERDGVDQLQDEVK